jgi:hypothetical protein
MLRHLPIAFLLLSPVVSSAAFAVLEDRPGIWSAEWTGLEVDESGDSAGVVLRGRGLERSAHEGDLDAPRLGALLAVPAGGAWKLEILEDSGRILSPRNWARIPHFDPATGRRSPVPPATPPDWTERTTGSIRLVSLDLPVARPLADGSVRVRTRLRVRATWTGSVRPTDGTSWRNLVDNPGGIGARAMVGASRSAGSSSSFPFDASGVKVVAVQVGDTSISSTLEDGVIRLTGAQLYQASGLQARSLHWRNVAVWTGSADTVPSANPGTVPSTSLHRLAVQWKAGATNDSILNPDDELRFWARGTSIWKPDTNLPGGWRFSIHPYSRTRRYYVVLGVADADGSPGLGSPRVPSSPVSVSAVPQPRWAGQPNQISEMIGEDTVSDHSAGNGWHWLDLRQSASVPSSMLTWPSTASLPGIVGDSAFATLQVVGSTAYQASKDPFPSNAVLFQGDGRKGGFLQSDRLSATWVLRGLGATGNRYQLDSARGYLVAGYTVTYPRDVSTLDSAAFPAPRLGALSIPVGAAGTCWVLEHGEAVRTCVVSNGALRDSATDPDTWYAVFGPSPGARPDSLIPLLRPNQSHAVASWNSTASADMVVVAPDEFLDVAESYAVWRADSKQLRPMTVKVVRLQDVWDRWSSGAMDPSGLRDGLRWMWSNWGISHALLLGAGHADARGVRNLMVPVSIPQWENLDQSTDDFYAWFDTTGIRLPALALGRVPARSVAEAQAWLDKVEVFENPVSDNLGPWRNSALFAADDQWQWPKLDDMGHERSIDAIAGIVDSLRPWLRDLRFYESSYPRNISSLKPDATLALVSRLNQGVAAFTYMGHGASTILSDEYLLDVASFTRTVDNPKRPFVFIAGSCTVGRHDDESTRGLGELFIVTKGRGSTASLAATRLTHPGDNQNLIERIWRRLLTGTAARTFGEAVLSAKLDPSISSGFNSMLYNILGDPALVLYPVPRTVTLDRLTDSLSALSRVQLSGTSAIAGTTQFNLLDPMAPDTFVAVKGSAWAKDIVGTTPRLILSSAVGMGSGKFSTGVLLPARIPFGDTARFSAYTWDSSSRSDGGAVTAYRKLAGAGSEIPSDRTGPEVRIRSCDPTWTAGAAYGKTIRFHLPFCLQVDLQDSSGISTSDNPDEGVVFSITGVRDAWHPDLRQGQDYRSAYTQIQFDSTWVQAGQTYDFRVSARDLMGNLTLASAQITPLAAGQYALYDVFASPNPVRSGEGTAFYFKLVSETDTGLSTSSSVDSRIESSVRIHTVSGKLVRVLRTELSNKVKLQPRATWDLRDSFGRPVANGIYPFTVVLRIPDETGSVTTDVVRRGVIAVAR